MSHVVTVDVAIRDLEALDQAARRCGLELQRGKTTFRWFGRWVADYHGHDAAYRHGVRPEDYGRCDHILAIPGDPGAYQVGVVRDPDGPGYRLVWDTWDGRLGPLLGLGGARLRQQYALAATRRVAARRGHRVEGEAALPDGGVRLRIRVPRQP